MADVSFLYHPNREFFYSKLANGDSGNAQGLSQRISQKKIGVGRAKANLIRSYWSF